MPRSEKRKHKSDRKWGGRTGLKGQKQERSLPFLPIKVRESTPNIILLILKISPN
jgi:hypothetical protein